MMSYRISYIAQPSRCEARSRLTWQCAPGLTCRAAAASTVHPMILAARDVADAVSLAAASRWPVVSQLGDDTGGNLHLSRRIWILESWHAISWHWSRYRVRFSLDPISENTRNQEIPDIGKYPISGSQNQAISYRVQYQDIRISCPTRYWDMSFQISCLISCLFRSFSSPLPVLVFLLLLLLLPPPPFQCEEIHASKAEKWTFSNHSLAAATGSESGTGPWPHSRLGLHSRPQPQSRLLPHS